MIPVIGKNEKNKEVISYPLASQMQDLEVEIAPELTKSSKTSPCTSAYYQASQVITSRDALEEFVAAGVWPSKPRCNTRKFHHNKILLATWFSFIF
jgi:hypothetical protein